MAKSEFEIKARSPRTSSAGWDILEKALLVWLPAALVAFRAGSRFSRIATNGSIGRLEGPQVGPRSPIFNLTQVFRYAVAYESMLYPNMTESNDWWTSESSTELVVDVDSRPEITVHCPEAFSSLREMFGIASLNWRKSLLESGPFVSFQSNSKGAARVGGVFFLSPEGSYLIKTIKEEEKDALLRMLPLYHEFMKSNAKTSLLTRLVGLYEIRWKSGGPRQYILVQNSVFPAEGSNGVFTHRYDLKGSTKGRLCSAEELEKPKVVLKDMDLVRDGRRMVIPATRKVLEQLRRDVSLLADCQLIDYSLLVGIVEINAGESIDYSTEKILCRYKNVVTDLDLQKWNSPLALVAAPSIKTWRAISSPITRAFRRTTSTVKRATVSSPFPYYGSDQCQVSGGSFSFLHGTRGNKPILVYIGVIDFLQPFNTVKELEWRYKKLRYGSGFSCVPPDEYASRFIDFVRDHVLDE